MLSFYIYAIPLSDYRAYSDRLAEGEISPLRYQQALAASLVVSGCEAEISAYLAHLSASGWAGPSVRLNAYTTAMAVQSGLLEAVLSERVAFVEAHLLPDIRQVNRKWLAQAAAAAEWTVVQVEED